MQVFTQYLVLISVHLWKVSCWDLIQREYMIFCLSVIRLGMMGHTVTCRVILQDIMTHQSLSSYTSAQLSCISLPGKFCSGVV